MIRRKWGVPGWVLAALAAIFIAGGAIGAATTADAIEPVRTRFEKVSHTEFRTLEPFTAVQVEQGDVGFGYMPDSRYGLEIRSIGKADYRKLNAYIKDKKLVVDGRNVTTEECHFICPYGPTNIEFIVHKPGGLVIEEPDDYTNYMLDSHDGSDGPL
jgi:hypothetical protein